MHLQILDDAVRAFINTHHRLPGSLSDLTVPDSSGRRWLEELCPDPWGNDYVLCAMAQENGDLAYTVACMGPDGALGTWDDIATRSRRRPGR